MKIDYCEFPTIFSTTGRRARMSRILDSGDVLLGITRSTQPSRDD